MARDMVGITQRGDRWFVAIRLGGGRPMFRGTFDTYTEARTARDKARDDARAGRAIIDHRTERITVAELAEAHLAGNAPRWSQRTIDLHASEWRSMAPTFGHRRVVELRPSDVADWVADLSSRRAANTVTGQLGLLRAILDRAAADLSITNVARVYKRPRGQGARVDRRRFALTDAQVAAIVEEAHPRYRIMVLLCLGLGLRSGEARGLTLDRVDMSTGRVVIDRQLLRVRRGAEWTEGDRVSTSHGFGHPKTRSSVGTVHADRDLLDAIADHVDTYGTGPCGLIVSGHRGQVLDDCQWSREMRRVSEVVGFEVTGHDLRHTRGSWALQAEGTTIADVAADLRHSVAMAVRTYLHADEPDAARTGAVMSRLGAASAASARKPRAERHLRAV